MGSVRADVCWLHPDIEVRRSPVHGLGLFACAPLAPDTTVSRLGGQLISTGELRAMLEQVERAERGYVDTITVALDRHLLLPAGTPNGRGNHSCDPNTWWIDAYTLAARRAIATDEEVTNDYATSTAEAAFTMTCACGSPLCRGVVRGADWRRAELRRRYGTHWVPAVLALIRASDK